MVSEKYISLFLEYNPNTLYPISLITNPSYTTATKLMYLLYNKNKFPKNLILDYIKEYPKQINKTNKDDFTPIIFELCHKNDPYIEGGQYDHDVEIFECLLSNGADPNLHVKKASPLYLCISNPYIINGYKFTELLLKYGADVNYNNFGTVLHKTINTCNIDLIKLLLKYGADVNAIDNEGETPLMILIKNKIGYYDLYNSRKSIDKIENIVQLLEEHNCNIFTKDSSGFNIFCQNEIEHKLYEKTLEIEKYKTLIRIITNKIFKRSESILMSPGTLRYNLLLIKWNNYDYDHVKIIHPHLINYFNIYDSDDFNLKISSALKYLN
ncbi:repeat protein [Moumouvirus goulette]|uniref:Repeat protein n=1 Tax=Moumouvirus goulette TaxID=1247379 RepID=M1PGB8_9VIRU|nr:repeat protein [Moumouvirus goulette]AGF85028.1 repeat protein [Moumouvirus goulette]